MSIDKDQYEIVRFAVKTTNSTTTKSGYKVGKFLVVGFADARRKSWRIYRSQDGLECIRTTFATADDAIRCAEWIREQYEDYFFIWTEYPNAELFRWTKYTIENGEEYMSFLENLVDQRNVEWDNVLQYIS
jgi:hypothetical protein